MKTFETLEKKLLAKEQSSWVPACGGTEEVFTKGNRRYLYMYNTFTNKHAYYCLDTDFFLSDDDALIIMSN